MSATDGSTTPGTVPAYTPPGGVGDGVGSSVGVGSGVALGETSAVLSVDGPEVALGAAAEHADTSAAAMRNVATLWRRLMR